MVLALGGQVITLGRGEARLNPLDPGAIGDALRRPPAGEAADQLFAELLGRQRMLVGGLVQLVRHAALGDYEDAALAAALRVLAERRPATGAGEPATITDLIACLQERPC